MLAACDCPELALKYVPEGESRPRKAIETARKWARGKATLEDAENAANQNGAHAAAETAAEAAATVAAAVFEHCADIVRGYIEVEE